ncbi:RNF138 [Lepeophtheirus salmonis]|uniref:RNF138 n=1 Tax=Lepeophtheirus salmonis TaxID=72036 RepID=A0A7R8CGQ1_LEPSM|nr:RNF138 [Lepeophtheirus salmonis]CAF2812934.1 RNF138 [Lepeophtheirus salmonis]
MRLYHREKDFVRILESTRNSFTDVELRGPEYGSMVRAHRAHLAHFSPFLKNLFRDPDRRTEPVITVLLDPGIHFPSVVTLLRLLYTGCIDEAFDSDAYARLEEKSRLLGFRLPGLTSSEVMLKEVQNFRCIGCQGAFHSLSQLESHSTTCRPSLDFISSKEENVPDPIQPIYECPPLREQILQHVHCPISSRKSLQETNHGSSGKDHEVPTMGFVPFVTLHIVLARVPSFGILNQGRLFPPEDVELNKSYEEPQPLQHQQQQQQQPVVVESIRKEPTFLPMFADKLECPRLYGELCGISQSAKTFCSSFLGIKSRTKLVKYPMILITVSYVLAHIPKCSLNHYGVSHHFVKDYLDPAIYEKYFSSHPNFKRQKLQQIPEENSFTMIEDGDFDVKPEIVPDDEEEEEPPKRKSRGGGILISLDSARNSNHQDKLAIILAEEGLALDVKKRGCYCFPCPICQKGEYVICELRLHMASHYRREIMEKIGNMTDDRTKCAICSAITFMDHSMYIKYFSTHPNFSNPMLGSSERDEDVPLDDEETYDEEIMDDYEDSRIFETEEEEIFEAEEETVPAFSWGEGYITESSLSRSAY